MNMTEKRDRSPKRTVRIILIAAAMIAALMATVAASSLVLRQTTTWFIESDNDIKTILENTQSQNDGAPGTVAVGGGYNGEWEYISLADSFDDWWNAYGQGILIEEKIGATEDGWTAMRRFQQEGADKTYQETRCFSENLSDFNSLWPVAVWDTAWVETQYTAVPNSMTYYACGDGELPEYFSACGEYRGDGAVVFNLQYSWIGNRSFGDSYQLTTGYDYTELYETIDGVTVAIKMATSNSGTPIFWASFTSGPSSFSMTGVYMELDGIRDILNSLNLSALCEHVTE